jgi:hypothetical protein
MRVQTFKARLLSSRSLRLSPATLLAPRPAVSFAVELRDSLSSISLAAICVPAFFICRTGGHTAVVTPMTGRACEVLRTAACSCHPWTRPPTRFISSWRSRFCLIGLCSFSFPLDVEGPAEASAGDGRSANLGSAALFAHAGHRQARIDLSCMSRLNASIIARRVRYGIGGLIHPRRVVELDSDGGREVRTMVPRSSA